MTLNVFPSSAGAFLAAFRSVGFLLVRPRLWLLVLAPFVLNLLMAAGVFALLHELAIDPLAAMAGEYLDWLGSWSLWLLQAVLIVIALLLTGVLSFFLFAIVSSPFNDLLTEQIEKELLSSRKDLMAPPQTLTESIIHSLLEAARRVLVVTPIVIIGFILGIVPVIGPPLSLAFTLINGMVFLSLDAFSYPLDRRRLPLREKWRFLRSNRPVWVPFGLGLAVFVLVPCSVFWLPMLASVAATRLYCAIRLAGAEPGTDLADGNGTVG